MIAWVHKMLLVVFGWFAFGAFNAVERLGGKALWMYVTRHRPAEAVIADIFQSIYIDFTVAVLAGIAVVWLERRFRPLAVRRSPAEARVALRAPEWFETMHSLIERMIALIDRFFALFRRI